MTAQLAPTPIQKFFDNNGNPLFNGKLYSYAAGTSTPQATYTDSTMGTQNTNPVILNARGEANVWLNPSLAYKLVLEDSVGNQIWAIDNIPGGFVGLSALASQTNPAGTTLVGYLGKTTGSQGETLQHRLDSVVYVRSLATAGNGTSISPYTGWEGSINVAGTYHFTPEYYAYSIAPNWAISGLILEGHGATIVHTGTGVALKIDNGSSYLESGPTLRDLIIQGNSNSTYGVYYNYVARSVFKNVRVSGCSTTGTAFGFFGAVLCDLDTLIASNNEGFISGAVPLNGIVFDGTGGTSSNYATQNTIKNMIIEGIGGIGVSILHSDQNIFVGGVSEGNPTGVSLSSNCHGHTFINVDFESNTSADISDAGNFNEFFNCSSGSAIANAVNITGSTSKYIGGRFTSITIGATANSITLQDISYGNSSGVLIDNSSNTTYKNVNNLTGASPSDKSPFSKTLPNLNLTGAATSVGSGINLSASLVATASAGTAVLPSAPAGFLEFYAGGTLCKIPYYNA